MCDTIDYNVSDNEVYTITRMREIHTVHTYLESDLLVAGGLSRMYVEPLGCGEAGIFGFEYILATSIHTYLPIPT